MIITVLFGILPLAAAGVARAQMCETPYEVIVTLRPPAFDFPTVWDADYGGDDRLTQFASGIALEDGTVLAYGRRLDQKTFRPMETGIAVINRRGRAMLERFFPAKEGENPVRIIRLGERLIAISNIAGGKAKDHRQARLSWYATQGDFKKEQIISDTAYDYEARDLLAAVDGGGFLVVLQAVNRQDEKDRHGIIMRLAPDGSVLWKRAYRPGIPNMIAGVTAIDDKTYIATGHIRIDDGRMAGWVMKLAYDGTILWQRTYPRGASSLIATAAASAKKSPDGTPHYLLVGEADPAIGGGNKAAWVMEIDPLGEPVWQRYFRRDDYALVGQGIRSYPDGRITFAVNAKAQEGMKESTATHDHVRLITLSPRGQMIQDESYVNGLGAQASQMLRGRNGETVIVGTIQADVMTEEEKREKMFGPVKPDSGGVKVPPPLPVQKGWIFLSPGLDFYNDPCLVPSRR